jgi:hypothetical protein
MLTFVEHTRDLSMFHRQLEFDIYGRNPKDELTSPLKSRFSYCSGEHCEGEWGDPKWISIVVIIFIEHFSTSIMALRSLIA